MSPGERRRRERKREQKATEYAAARSAITAQGGRCGNCEHLLRNPGTLQGLYCDLDSDFHGYVTTKASSVCPRWRRNKHDQCCVETGSDIKP